MSWLPVPFWQFSGRPGYSHLGESCQGVEGEVLVGGVRFRPFSSVHTGQNVRMRSLNSAQWPPKARALLQLSEKSPCLLRSTAAMYIKHIVIDGFKSYAQRTEVGPFDPMFNAITGLNGSGKSNILDAICFLLGISNLSQV